MLVAVGRRFVARLGATMSLMPSEMPIQVQVPDFEEREAMSHSDIFNAVAAEAIE